ncbi:Hypothetical_protein [Hexamita inflata]|uniref:Hypothetical_protein n=1 Tax=Hexamita inflata TaxID=28002 RepID=A0AA86Q1L9_9EUKA|nr:Hypothetical protein HINF_LOCUS31359 [Hexamita inflata]
MDNKYFQYCQKSAQMNNILVQDQLQLSQYSSNIFIYTKVTQNSQINANLNSVKAFAIFGFNQANQNISNCVINISINFIINQGALICEFCDLDVQNSTLIFIASGQQLSGLVLQSNSIFKVQDTSVQYRLNASQSSGLIYSAPQQIQQFSLLNVQIVGYHFKVYAHTAYIVSQLKSNLQVNISSLSVCVDLSINSVGTTGFTIIYIGNETRQCIDVCAQHTVSIYGVCIAGLQYSVLQQNSTWLCVDSFEFNGSHCVCQEGFVLNGSFCVNLSASLNNIQHSIKANYDTLLQKIQDQISGSSVAQIEQYIIGNSSVLQDEINTLNDKNIKQQDLLLQLHNYTVDNIFQLDTNIIQNFTNFALAIDTLKQNINNLDSQQYILNLSIVNRTANLDALQNRSNWITQNISSVNQTMNYFNEQLQNNLSILYTTSASQFNQTQQFLVDNINKLNESLKNDTKYLTQLINESVILLNSNLTQLEQQAQTLNTSFQDKYINISFNLSNLTVFTQNQFNSLSSFIVQNFSALTQNLTSSTEMLDQYIYYNFSSLEQSITNQTNILNLLNNSIDIQPIMSNISNIQNIIWILNRSVFRNFTNVNNSLDNLNTNQRSQNAQLTNIQSKLSTINVTYLLNQLANLQQQIILIQQSNQETDIILQDGNLIQLICNQQKYIQYFDITTVTQNVSAFIGQYAIAQETNDAFINIQDSVLNSVSNYNIFQTQSYFYNLKVQVGTQTVNSGSILTNQLTSVLNQVSIISRLGSTISVNSAAQLNVIQQRSTSTSVRNLLINLLFLSTSTGNITLIGTVEDIINIKNYQILGKYYSTNQLCLGALESNNSQIFLQMVNMQPANFVVGNQSAYLLVFINRSQVQVSKVSLILDNGVRTSIATTNVRVLQFGGIIQNMNCSAVSIKAVSQRDTSQFITNYVSNSGLLIGSTTLDSVNELSLSQICSYVQLSFKTTTWINSFGLVGQYCGKLSILSVQLQASIGSSQLQCFGVIGMILSATYQVVIQNIIITITMVSKGAYDINEENISSLIGSVTAFDIQISDANINCSTVAAYSNCALLIGYQFQTQVSVLNTNVNSSNAKSNSSVGGLIAVCIDSVVQINAVIMQSINTSASGSVALAGILIGSLDQSRQVIADLLINSSSAQSITSTSQAMSGGFCAQSLSSDNLIINSQILGTNSSAQGITAYAGSIVGQHTRVDKLTMQNCLISLTQVNAAATTIHAGIISGQCSSQTTLILLYSFSNSNTLNGATTTSCQLGSAQSDGC